MNEVERSSHLGEAYMLSKNLYILMAAHIVSQEEGLGRALGWGSGGLDRVLRGRDGRLNGEQGLSHGN